MEHQDMNPSIGSRSEPAVCLGKARVRGTRITVEFVLKLMGNGYDAKDIVHDYPN